MVSNVGNVLRAIKSLEQIGLIDEGSLHDIFADLTTSKKALCLCMADGSTLLLSK